MSSIQPNPGSSTTLITHDPTHFNEPLATLSRALTKLEEAVGQQEKLIPAQVTELNRINGELEEIKIPNNKERVYGTGHIIDADPESLKNIEDRIKLLEQKRPKTNHGRRLGVGGTLALIAYFFHKSKGTALSRIQDGLSQATTRFTEVRTQAPTMSDIGGSLRNFASKTLTNPYTAQAAAHLAGVTSAVKGVAKEVATSAQNKTLLPDLADGAINLLEKGAILAAKNPEIAAFTAFVGTAYAIGAIYKRHQETARLAEQAASRSEDAITDLINKAAKAAELRAVTSNVSVRKIAKEMDSKRLAEQAASRSAVDAGAKEAANARAEDKEDAAKEEKLRRSAEQAAKRSTVNKDLPKDPLAASKEKYNNRQAVKAAEEAAVKAAVKAAEEAANAVKAEAERRSRFFPSALTKPASGLDRHIENMNRFKSTADRVVDAMVKFFGRISDALNSFLAVICKEDKPNKAAAHTRNGEASMQVIRSGQKKPKNISPRDSVHRDHLRQNENNVVTTSVSDQIALAKLRDITFKSAFGEAHPPVVAPVAAPANVEPVVAPAAVPVKPGVSKRIAELEQRISKTIAELEQTEREKRSRALSLGGVGK